MRILLISDNYSHGNQKDILHKNLIETIKENYSDIKIYLLNEDDMHHCIGCFNCWIKTPGLCTINDLGQNTAKDFINYDLIIFVTEVKFGCYSPSIKKVLDRIIPLVLPFFKKLKGEMHHAPRYNKYPEIIVLGYGKNITPEEENTLNKLALANAINFQKDKAKTYIFRNKDEISSTLNNMIEYISKIGCEK